jgi:hypothetical protein
LRLPHLASSSKLETAPTAGPWPQAARAWIELGLCGSAACQRCPALCSCCLPCLKGQTQLTLHHPAAHSRPTLAVTAAPGDGISPRHRLGRKCPLHGSYHHTETPCLACCIAPAFTSHARVPQLSVGCSGPFRGVQARDCNLLQTGKSATSGWVAAARRCSGKTTRKWLRLQGKLDTHPNCVSELFKAVRSYSDRCRCPRDLISGRF